ncbi:MAG: aminoacetone oxidase family FAD-binding enzyme [Muribaculaceae bacterium]|nr:aminoacetone oxidase family FAD-binding enzyme [Muribaculaceae bacterium]
MKKKIAVIGGGASGMMAAIQASKSGALVELYERNDRVGKKLLATGNGKCNFSNRDMDSDAYYGSAVSLCQKLYTIFGVSETVDCFGQLGMLVKDKNGYLYPLSEQASTVLDVLRFSLEQSGIVVHTGLQIEAILPQPETGKLRLKPISGKAAASQKFLYDAVILACGGMAAPKTGSDGNGFQIAKKLGHHIVESVPALVQLRCKETFLKSVAGVRTGAALTLLIDGREAKTVQGELQLTDYGISGIPVFQFSREAAYALSHKKKVSVEIDFLPAYEQAVYEAFWQKRFTAFHGRTLEQCLTGISNKKINQLIIRLADAKPLTVVDDLPEKTRNLIALLYRKLTVTVYATNGFEQAQVSAGGIPAGELTEQLESKLVPHVYFAGEIVDIDGICGGYNLQWAWTSGTIAGRAAAGNKNDIQKE